MPFDGALQLVHALEQRPIEQRLAIAIHDVEDHRLQRQLGLGVADAVLAPAARRLLERQELLRQRVERQRFGVQDGGLGLHLRQDAVDQLREHAGQRLQAARKETHLVPSGLRAIEMELDTDAVELELRVRPTAELVDQAGDVGALGELRSDRSAHGDLQLAHSVEPRSTAFADEPEVRGAVVAVFEDTCSRFLRAVQVRLVNAARIVASPTPSGCSQRNANQVLGRRRVEPAQQLGAAVQLPFGATRTADVRRLSKRANTFSHRGLTSLTDEPAEGVCAAQLFHDQAQIAAPCVTCAPRPFETVRVATAFSIDRSRRPNSIGS